MATFSNDRNSSQITRKQRKSACEHMQNSVKRNLYKIFSIVIILALVVTIMAFNKIATNDPNYTYESLIRVNPEYIHFFDGTMMGFGKLAFTSPQFWFIFGSVTLVTYFGLLL
eukprot:503382_1